MAQSATDDENSEHLIDISRRTMIEIEATLSETENIVSTLSLLTREDFEPYRGLIIRHLEEILSRMKNLGDDGDGARTDSTHSEENDDENVEGVQGNKVCRYFGYLLYLDL